MGYGIYTMRETHIAEGDMSFSHGISALEYRGHEFDSHQGKVSTIRHGSKKSYTISGLQNGCHIPLPLNHGRGIWDHIPLVIVASDSLRIWVMG